MSVHALSSVKDIFSNIGKCSKCMKLAFMAAAASAAISVATSILAPLWLTLLFTLVTTALAALWIAHVWLYTRRSIRATAALAQPQNIEARQAELWPRRRILKAFFRTLLFSAMVSIIPRSAFAQECNCYTENGCSCPPDFPNCVYNASTGEAICCGPSAVGCTGPEYTWCCPPGSSCYGTNRQCHG